MYICLCIYSSLLTKLNRNTFRQTPSRVHVNAFYGRPRLTCPRKPRSEPWSVQEPPETETVTETEDKPHSHTDHHIHSAVPAKHPPYLQTKPIHPLEAIRSDLILHWVEQEHEPVEAHLQPCRLRAAYGGLLRRKGPVRPAHLLGALDRRQIM